MEGATYFSYSWLGMLDDGYVGCVQVLRLGDFHLLRPKHLCLSQTGAEQAIIRTHSRQFVPVLSGTANLLTKMYFQ